jgi:hypothetical protein
MIAKAGAAASDSQSAAPSAAGWSLASRLEVQAHPLA